MSKSEIETALYGRRKNKYGVCPPEERTADGIVFHSGHEKDVYLSFKALHRAGTFTSLKLQVPFPIYVLDIEAFLRKWPLLHERFECHGTIGFTTKFLAEIGILREIFVWFADFVVRDLDDREHVYDAKGWDEKKQKFVSTDIYKLKKRAVEAQYSIRILEV